jgi:beta-lactamase class A
MKRLIVRQGFLLLTAAILAGSAGWYAHSWYTRHYENHAERWVVSHKYEFTSPLLDVELPEGFNVDHEPLPFKYKVVAFVKEKIESRQASDISVYYRDLHDGPWFGINHKIEFNPASMMKVPVMVAWLKRAEKNPAILKRRMKYVELKNSIPEQFTKPALTLAPGQSYSIDELLRYMMNYSDNKATALLYKALSDEELGDVLDNMDINNNPHEEGNFLTIHGYSGFFRILYNAAYLNRDMSEKALQLLSLQDFPMGIAAGVPKGIKVAAKFGEIVSENKNEDIQLHEFGIVYHPKGHYILGVMTRGHDFAAQAEIIRDVSKMIYSEVDSSTRN